MLYACLCIAELFLLFPVSRSLTRNISFMLYRLTHSKRMTIYLLAMLFLPGTIIHELAHFFMARILFVHSGNIRLLPELEDHTTSDSGQYSLKLGSVAIGHTDPLRRFLIGAAPFFIGTIIILATILMLIRFDFTTNYWLTILTGYIVFEIGNTMFSSKKDMEGALELLIICIIIITVLIFFRIRIEAPLISLLQTQSLEPVFKTASLILAAPLVLDIFIIAVIKLIHNKLR